jgi:uncharacterized membrane protein YeaQ/YmgE (transglycosylase-associated protein family)
VFEFSISLGLVGWALIIVGAITLGLVAQFIGEPRFSFEWVVTAIAAGIGALVASEFIVDLRGFEPVYDGLALIPALVGGLIAGIVAAVTTRYVTGGSYLPHAATT